jgi:hypothetical protein
MDAIELDRDPTKVLSRIMLCVVVDVIDSLKKFWRRIENPGKRH